MAGQTLKSFDSATGGSDKSNELNQGVKSTSVFYTAVVMDFISNPVEDLQKIPLNEEAAGSDLTLAASLGSGLNSVSNPARISRMPRNSIVAWRTTERACYEEQPEIFYPFFSPHMCLPVKAGEKIWVIYESMGATGGLGYWISRKTGDESIDDLNYTHIDRATLNVKQNQSSENSAQTAIEGDTSSDYDPLCFTPGGGRTKANNTMPDIDSQNAYDSIVAASDAYQNQYTAEPIPRFSKRSPDFTLQGSNNTLICLGEDRGRTLDTEDDANTIPVDTSIHSKGTIDIVAGRSVLMPDGTFIADIVTDLDPSTGDSGSSDIITGPAAVAKNIRELGEIDKTPVVTDSNADGPNINEGDPDFINDLSRLYVSMKTSGDTNFGLMSDDLPAYPVLNDGTEVEAVDEAPYTILRSNEVRVIAKYNEDQEINGSIKIIKEGVEDDNEDGTGRAVIIMQPDGTIMIDGPKIIIGSAGNAGDPGEGEQIYLGRDATEPLVLGDELKDLLDQYFNDMKTWLSSAYDTHTHTCAVGGSSPPLVVGDNAGTQTGLDDTENILSTNGKVI